MRVINVEALDDLKLKGLKIIQNDEYFKFGIDSVLLADFAKIRRNKTVVDFGTGNGVIPLLLYGRYEGIRIKGIELIKDLCELADRNVRLNGLESFIEIINGDIRKAIEIFGKGKTDYVVANPPYLKGDGLLNDNEYKRIARHELACTVRELTTQAAGILRDGGIMYMVHRANRLTDALYEMRTAGLEPKILRFVAKNEKSAPHIFLVKCMKNAKAGLVIRNTLYIYGSNGEYTGEIMEIYGHA